MKLFFSLIFLLLMGCSKEDDSSQTVRKLDLLNMESFESCGAISEFLEAREPIAMPVAQGDVAETSSQPPPSSGTNNQISGFEEGDLAIQREDLFFSAGGATLTLSALRGLELQILDQALLDSAIQKIILQNQTLLVATQNKLHLISFELEKFGLLKSVTTKGKISQVRFGADSVLVISNQFLSWNKEVYQGHLPVGVECSKTVAISGSHTDSLTQYQILNMSDLSLKDSQIVLGNHNSLAPLYISPTSIITTHPGLMMNETLHFMNWQGGKLQHVGAKSYGGWILNSLSFHENDQAFFLALNRPRDNQLIAIDKTNLKIIGESLPFGENQSIFSNRFEGNLFYANTFNQVDPYYILDYSDPTDIRQLAELEIPGFATYLHKLSEDFMLGTGFETDADGFSLGTKLFLFDNSDLANPALVQELFYPEDVGSRITAWHIQRDHLFFQYLPEFGIFSVPSQGSAQRGGWSSIDAALPPYGYRHHLYSFSGNSIAKEKSLDFPDMPSLNAYSRTFALDSLLVVITPNQAKLLGLEEFEEIQSLDLPPSSLTLFIGVCGNEF